MNTLIKMRRDKRNSSQKDNDKANYWVNDLDNQILQNVHQINFTAENLARLMNVSVRQLYRNIEKYTGQTAHQYLKSYRLNHAHLLLTSGRVNSVKAAAYSTGFPNPEYFSKQFKAEFGCLPSKLLR